MRSCPECGKELAHLGGDYWKCPTHGVVGIAGSGPPGFDAGLEVGGTTHEPSCPECGAELTRVGPDSWTCSTHGAVRVGRVIDLSQPLTSEQLVPDPVLSQTGLLRLAELVLHRARLLEGDMHALIEAEERKGRTVPLAAVTRMVSGFVKDYVVPVQGPLREAVGFDGPGGGWYMAAEEARAKLVAAPRARARLEEERRG